MAATKEFTDDLDEIEVEEDAERELQEAEEKHHQEIKKLKKVGRELYNVLTSRKKIHKDKDAEPTEFVESVVRAFFDLENTNQELKGCHIDGYLEDIETSKERLCSLCPRGRTLTAVHDAILENIVLPTKIVGRHIGYKVDGSIVMKVFLDPKEQNNSKYKLDTFSTVYRKLLLGKMSYLSTRSQRHRSSVQKA